MSIVLKQGGQKTVIPIWSSEIGLVDINNKFEGKKNVEDALQLLKEKFSIFRFYDGITSINSAFVQSTPIKTIVQSMNEDSILIDATVGESNNVYPTSNGLLLVIKQKGVYRNICKWINQSGVTGLSEYIGYVSNEEWSGWKQLAITENVGITLLNGWRPYDVHPMMTISGKLMAINMRINSGVYTNGTVIANTGKILTGSGSYLFPATETNGTVVGSVAITDTGSIVIIGAFKHNTDISINFTVSIK